MGDNGKYHCICCVQRLVGLYLGLFMDGRCRCFIEGAVLGLFKGKCPLTVWARQYSDSQKDNFDIYLPEWLARYNKLIFTTVFVVALAMLLWWYL